MSDLEQAPAVEQELVAETQEDKAIVTEGLQKTTAVDRQFIRDQVAEGLMRPMECARKYSISIQYVSKILKAAKITFGCRKIEREEQEKKEREAKERAIRATFAERQAAYAEEHKLSIYQQYRSALLLEAMRQKTWREAASNPTGAVLPTTKDAMTSARTMALIDQRIRVLLDLNNAIDEKALPTIEIIDMGDAEIAAIRRGKLNEDELAKLDDDIIEEAP